MWVGEEIKEEERVAFCVSKKFWWVSTAIQQLPPLVGQATAPYRFDSDVPRG